MSSDADIWHKAHEIAESEIARIRAGQWGGGHEPHPGLAAAIANFAVACRNAEREACAKLAAGFGAADCDYRGAQDPETGEVPCSRESRGDTCLCVEHQEVADAIAANIRARNI